MSESLGWLASLVLLSTIFAQVLKQWRSGTARGVSYWLFAGQATGSALFVGYSVLVENAVFAFTNAMIFIAAGLGFALTCAQKRRETSPTSPRA